LSIFFAGVLVYNAGCFHGGRGGVKISLSLVGRVKSVLTYDTVFNCISQVAATAQEQATITLRYVPTAVVFVSILITFNF